MGYERFLKIFLVLCTFLLIRIRIVLAWIRIRIKVHPGSGSVTNLFTSWMDPDPYQNDTDPPQLREGLAFHIATTKFFVSIDFCGALFWSAPSS